MTLSIKTDDSVDYNNKIALVIAITVDEKQARFAVHFEKTASPDEVSSKLIRLSEMIRRHDYIK